MRYTFALMTVILASMLFTSCGQVNKKQEMPESSGDNNSPHQFQSEGDADADRLMKEADNDYDMYKETPNDDTKKAAEKKCFDAAMYLMYDAQLPPKDKYKSALKYFRVVLKLDPGNEEAKLNKDKIEEIYRQMGKPIPETDI